MNKIADMGSGRLARGHAILNAPGRGAWVDGKTTARRSTTSTSPLRSAAPPPFSGQSCLTTTAPAPARHTSLMLPALLLAPGTATATTTLALGICLSCLAPGGRTRGIPPTSTVTTTFASRSFSCCWPTGVPARNQLSPTHCNHHTCGLHRPGVFLCTLRSPWRSDSIDLRRRPMVRSIPKEWPTYGLMSGRVRLGPGAVW